MPVETRVEAVAGPAYEAALAADAEALAVPVFKGTDGARITGRDAELAGGLLPLGLTDLLAFHQAKGDPGEVTAATVRLGERVAELLLYGVGEGGEAELRTAGARLARRLKGRGTAVVVPPEGDCVLAAFAEGALLASYEFRIGAATPERRRPVGTLAIVTGDQAALDRGAVIAGAAVLARDLTNTPSVDKCPAWLADRAAELAAGSGLTLRVRDEHALREEGFGGLLAVGAGSPRPPRLIELSYTPDETTSQTPHYVLVGKGITFDTGGLSLKPNDNMKTMKTDMGGSAVVMAVMSAVRSLGVAARVTGLIASAENMPSGSAMRPSDVITHFGGKTSEVLNTDAEGRLVLADALAYADQELDPDVVVDIATLTGAAKVALGLRHGALFANDDDLAEALIVAGRDGGEPLWRLPLIDEYKVAIESDVADLSNIERRGFGGGAIMAALFLREFVGDRRWAHLDIAGPGRAMSDDAEISKGATGFGARLLLRWLSAA